MKIICACICSLTIMKIDVYIFVHISYYMCSTYVSTLQCYYIRIDNDNTSMATAMCIWCFHTGYNEVLLYSSVITERILAKC